MSTFTSFDAPTGVAVGNGGRRADALDFDTGGVGLATAGRAVSGFAEKLKAREERKAGLAREETVANDTLHFKTRLAELEALGDEHAVETVTQEMDAHFAANSEAMGTQTAREDYELQTAKMRASIMGDAIGIDAVSVARNERTSLTNIIDININSVREDPSDSNLQASLAQLDRVVDGSRLVGQDREDLRAQNVEALQAARVDGMLSSKNVKSSTQAKAVLARLETEEFKDLLDPTVYDQALTKAQRLVDQYTIQEQNDIITGINSDLPEVEDGRSGMTISEDRINAISDPDKRAETREIAERAAKIGSFNRAVQGMDLQQLRLAETIILQDLTTRGGDFKLESASERIIASAISRAEQAADEATRVAISADQELFKSLEGTLIEISDNVEGAGVSDEQLDAFQTPEGRQAAEMAIARSEDVAEIRHFVENAPNNEIAKLFNEFLIAKDTPGDRVTDDENLTILLMLYEQRQRSIDADRNAYARRVNPAADAASLAFENDPSQENLTALVSAHTAAQVALGKDPRDVYLLGADEIAALKQQQRGLATEADVPEAVDEFIVGLERQYNKQWPLVMKQLKEQSVFTGLDLIAAGMTRLDQAAARQELLVANAAIAENPNVYLDQLTTEQRTEIDDGVLAGLSGLRGTLGRIAGGPQASADRLYAAQVLVRSRVVNQRSSVEDAVTNVLNEIVLGNYEPIGEGDTYRVPLSANISSSAVDRTLNQVLSLAMNFDRFKIPENDGLTLEQRRADFEAVVRDRGFWVTNGDESGVIFMDGANPIKQLDGSLVEIKWEEMRGPTAATNLFGAKGKFK